MPVAVAGVCGGLDPAMRPGDLVVATEVRYGTTTTACPSAEPLAAELRRAGLTVHTGPIVTVDRMAGGAERAALARSGACAVDMESGVLAALSRDRPLVVVRAVADTSDRPLLGPHTLTGGIAGLAALRRIGPALATWAAATGPRKVLAASPQALEIDAPRPPVPSVHAEARRFAGSGDLVIVIGHAGHEEIEGTLGEVPDSIAVVRSVADVARLAPADPARVRYLMQARLPVAEVADIVAAIEERFPAVRGPGTDDICSATTNGQQAVRAIAARSDLVLVVGSAGSSNSVGLVEAAERSGTPALLVDDPGGLDLGLLAGARVIGVTACVSAPPALVEAVIVALGGLGPVEVEEHVVTTETVQFSLPKGVRL